MQKLPAREGRPTRHHGHSTGSWRSKELAEALGQHPKDERYGRWIRGVGPSDLKFMGDDSGCSVGNGLEGDRAACRGLGRLPQWEPETTGVEVGRGGWLG